MKDERKIIVIASHNAEDIRVLCDEVHEMERGNCYDRKGTIKQTLLGGLTVGLLLLLFVLSGCGNTKNQQEDKNQQVQSAETEGKEVNFSEDKYLENRRRQNGYHRISEYTMSRKAENPESVLSEHSFYRGLCV